MLTTKWFSGGELALAVGVNLSVGRLGGVLNDLLSPRLAYRHSIPHALWFGFNTCILSFICAALAIYVDQRYAYHSLDLTTTLRKEHIPLYSINDDEGLQNVFDDGGVSDPMDELEEIDEPEAILESPSKDAHVESHQVHRKHRKKSYIKLSDCEIETSKARVSIGIREALMKEKNILFRGIRLLPHTFWLIQLIMILLFGTVTPFNMVHGAFLSRKWYKNDPEFAAQVMGVPDTLSAILVPFAGTYFDRRGHRVRAIILCAIINASCHLMLGTLPITILHSPIPILMVMGASWALLLTFVPCIPLIVPESFLGAAYGISTSLANFSWTAFPVIVAVLSSADETYLSTELFFAVCGLIAFVLGIWVYQLNSNLHASVLEKPAPRFQKEVPSSPLWEAPFAPTPFRHA